MNYRTSLLVLKRKLYYSSKTFQKRYNFKAADNYIFLNSHRNMISETLIVLFLKNLSEDINLMFKIDFVSNNIWPGSGEF